jgi:HlyD family secretion protein
MKNQSLNRRNLALFTVVAALLSLLAYVALRSGPLAPVAVTLARVEARRITPALFGVAVVEARYTYKIGPTGVGRVKWLAIDVGDQVHAGQVIGEMEPVDLDSLIESRESALKRVGATLTDAQARQVFAQTQMQRYQKLNAAHLTSAEIVATKQQELQIANAALAVTLQDQARAASDRDAALAQRGNLRLVAPIDGVVALRGADPGSTIVAGQAVVELIDPAALWLNVRFDQISAKGLVAGLTANIVLRSGGEQILKGRIVRVEPRADAVTEEILAKVSFDEMPQALPPVGELAEVTINLPALAAAPSILNAAVRRDDGKLGVWLIEEAVLRFTPIKLGEADLEGHVQVRAGLKIGDQVVIYSEKPLTAQSRVHIVAAVPGASDASVSDFEAAQ